MPKVALTKWTPKGFVDVDYEVGSLKEVAAHESRDSVYTVDRTYPDLTVIKFKEHIDRLEDSARREGISLRLDRNRIRQVLREFFEQTGFELIRYRIAVSREEPDCLYLAAEEFFPPSAQLIESGVRCAVLSGAARRNPASKTADWMSDREQYRLPDWAYEGLLVDGDHRILEGATSNFYAILDGRLRTAGDGVLPGIARQIVLEVAAPIMTVELDAVRLEDVPHLEGAFLTSASRGIVPIVQIDDDEIAEGKPTAVVDGLRGAYNDWVERNLSSL